MPRKTIEEQLVEAINSSDFEKAKILADKIKKKKAVRTPVVKKNKKNITKTNKNKKIKPIDTEDSVIYNAEPEKVSPKHEESLNKVATRKEKLFIGQRKNLFVDDLSEHSDELGIVLTRPIQNKKPKFKLISINCKLCGKTYQVAPSFARYDDEGGSLYRCDSCCGGK